MTARPDTGSAGTPARPRTLVPLPPDSAEALYYEGMAAYQHRNWEQALERFTRLKELQPARPGLEALLDEVRWFLQLQATAPAAALPPLETTSSAASPDRAGADRPGRGARQAARLGRWQTLGAITLAVIGVVALLLFVFRDRLPWSQASDREAQETFNRGQARLVVGDYEGAEAAFTQLLEISPDNREAQLGLEAAQRQKTLAQGYAAAEAAIAEENWEQAAAELERLLAIDPSYADAQARADFVSQRRRLAELYNDGSRLYDLGQWEEALVQFEKIRELDSAYRTEAVGEFLFVCYLNAGEAIVERAGGDVALVMRAVEHFSNALAIHPRNRLASDARRLGGLYLDAVRALANGDRSEAQSQLEALLAEAPEYGGGEAASQLYQLLLNGAESAFQAGDFPMAIRLYSQAQTVPGVDVSAASRGESLARSVTPTPTPRPTATTTPTPRPRPVAVVAPAALQPSGATPRPTTPPAALSACISGQVRDVAGGQPLANWTVTLVGPAGLTLSARTASDGAYRFANLSAGSYTVSENLEATWSAVSPVSTTITVAPAPACVVVDFWNGRSESGAAPTPPR